MIQGLQILNDGRVVMSCRCQWTSQGFRVLVTECPIHNYRLHKKEVDAAVKAKQEEWANLPTGPTAPNPPAKTREDLLDEALLAVRDKANEIERRYSGGDRPSSPSATFVELSCAVDAAVIRTRK